MFRTANPVMSRGFGNSNTNFVPSYANSSSNSMSVNGTITKTGLLLLIACVTGAMVWEKFTNSVDMTTGLPNPAAITGWMMLGGIGGFITALITIFKKHLANITAPIYAGLEGLFLGGISAIFEMRYPGIVFNAILATLGVLAVMLVAYRSGVIRVTEKFKMGLCAATGGIAIVYLINFAMSFFGGSMGIVSGSGNMAIIFSLIVCAVAALNLVMDFDIIEKGANSGAPKYMEWYGAFALMVTLVWLYIEILRLLSKLNRR